MLGAALGAGASANAKGCIKGAIVGGVAGHRAGHGAVGTAAGCVIGHHEANKRQNANLESLTAAWLAVFVAKIMARSNRPLAELDFWKRNRRPTLQAQPLTLANVQICL